MSDSFNFKVGPPDDAENAAIMRLGLSARKDAARAFKRITNIVVEHAPDCTAKEGLGYQAQGMISLAAYSLALTQFMLTEIGLKWNEGEEPTITVLAKQVEGLAEKFLERMNERP